MVTSSIAGVGEVISEVNETFVKPTMDEMSDQAIKMLNDVAEMIDVPEEERQEGKALQRPNNTVAEVVVDEKHGNEGIEGDEKAPILQQTRPQTKNNTNSATSANEPPVNGNIEYNSPLISFIQSGAEFVGEVLQQGVDVLQRPEAQGVYQPMMDAGAELAHQSLNALEQVGEKAISVLTSEVVSSESIKAVPTFFNISSAGALPDSPRIELESKDDEIPVFTAEFLLRKGPEALERLAVLSIENQLKYQGLVQKYQLAQVENFEASETLLDRVQELVDIYEKETDEDDELEFALPAFFDGESYQQQYQTYLNCITALMSHLAYDAGVDDGLDSIQKNQALLNNCSSKMGVVCAQVMQQYVLLGELLLLAGQQQGHTLDMKAVAEFGAHSYAYFEQSFQNIATEYLDQIDAVSPNFEELKNKIYIGMGKCITNIQNARSSLLPLCKFLYARQVADIK